MLPRVLPLQLHQSKISKSDYKTLKTNSWLEAASKCDVFLDCVAIIYSFMRNMLSNSSMILQNTFGNSIVDGFVAFINEYKEKIKSAHNRCS